jgi:hypothetical protein
MTSHEVFTTNSNPWNPGPAWLAQEFLNDLWPSTPDEPQGD